MQVVIFLWYLLCRSMILSSFGTEHRLLNEVAGEGSKRIPRIHILFLLSTSAGATHILQSKPQEYLSIPHLHSRHLTSFPMGP